MALSPSSISSIETRGGLVYLAQTPSPSPKGFPPEDPNKPGFREELPDSRSYHHFQQMQQTDKIQTGWYMDLNACNEGGSFGGQCLGSGIRTNPLFRPSKPEDVSFEALEKDFNFWMQKGRLDEAGKILETVKKKFPQKSERFMLEAQYFFRSNQKRQAFAVAEEWVRTNPADTRAHYALLELMGKDVDQREKVLQHVDTMLKGEELDDLDSWVVDFAIVTYVETEQYEKAQRFLNIAKKTHPDLVDYLVVQALLYEEQEDRTGLEQVTDEILLKDPVNLVANYLKGLLLLGEKPIEKAYPYFQHCYDNWAKKGDPTRTPPEILGQNSLMQGQLFVDIDPGVIWFALGEQQFQTKNYKMADVHLKKALESIHLSDDRKDTAKKHLQIVELSILQAK